MCVFSENKQEQLNNLEIFLLNELNMAIEQSCGTGIVLTMKNIQSALFLA